MRKRRMGEEEPLSEYWKPPADSGLVGDIGEPVTCLATTFEFDAGFFEAELLPRFLGLRFDHTENERTFIVEREEALATTNVAVLVDTSRFDPGQTTLQWDQLPIQVPGGIQHGKLTLLVWERLVRLIVASANLTRPGYRRNREVFAALDFFDGADSAPYAPLRDALDFIGVLCTWSRALPAATQRVRGVVEQIRARVRHWSSMPQDFGPRERPRVSLVAGHPPYKAGPAQSVLDQLVDLWLPRRVLHLTVMTPFVGQGVDEEDPVLSRMGRLPMARGAEGWLVVPEAAAPEEGTRHIVPLPKHFGRGWKKRFRQGAHILPVPLYVEGKDDKPRILHAKALLIEGDSYDLMMIGSSNLTPHGMGIGAFNCEVNLVFEDRADEKRDGRAFDDRLGIPVPWEEALGADDVVWREPDQAPEDAPPSKPHLPAFFAWASYSQTTGEIRVGLDRGQAEPSAWTVCLAGQSAEQPATLFSQATPPENAAILRFILDEKARGIHLTALRVDWQDAEESRHDGFLAVSVEDRETDLLAPEEFRNLSVDSIIECLLSGREPAEWFERQHVGRKRTPSTDAAIESLRAVDTSNYLLYRARRFGRALTAMADRIARTAPTPDAIRYRLLRDPLGPVHLAERLSGENHAPNDEVMSVTIGYQLYVLAEMVLSLGYVGQRIQRVAGRDVRWVTSLFLEAGTKLKTIVRKLQGQIKTLPDGLGRYMEMALAENARLLGTREENK
jgi:hypothetical protein